mmetsp:Transcript_6915/g.14141  ORF Transcript_6915/g.14141 Transcript_6915/m.14141 type:complete len:144 (-) Transcript_6915:151-582(-)
MNPVNSMPIHERPAYRDGDGQPLFAEEGGTVMTSHQQQGNPMTMTATATRFPSNGGDITWRRENWGCGICIFLTGLALSFVLLLPNVMLSDAGTAQAKRHASFGIMATLFFFVGGIVGLTTSMGWWALLPGVVMQLLAFMPLY